MPICCASAAYCVYMSIAPCSEAIEACRFIALLFTRR